MKITGAELQQFMDTGWPKPENDWCWDHDLFEDRPDHETVYDTSEIEGLFWQGSSAPPDGKYDLSLDGQIRKWRKARTTETIVIEAPKDRRDELLAAIKAVGGKVLK